MYSDIVIQGKEIYIGYPKTKRGGKTVLYKDLSFELYNGELVCLLGANGAGKSTLLRTISNLQPTLGGKILLNEKNIISYSDKELSRLMGLVLTDKTSIGGLTVQELVELGRYPYTGFFGQLNKNDKAIVNKAITDVGIAHKINSYISELSDGERQKAMIAKTLAQECSIIILDEPTAFLDVKSSIEIISLLHQLAANQEKTILLSTHNIDLALLLADRLWLLSKEHGLQCGITEDIVLADKMNNFFDSKNIMFNKESGSFTPKPSGVKKAFIHTENDLYHYWTKNILARYDIQTIDKKEDGVIEIEVLSPISIKLIYNNIKVNLSSYEELFKWLRDNNY